MEVGAVGAEAFSEQASHRGLAGSARPLSGGKYLSIISYKRDGTEVATPVWFVQEGGSLLAETDAQSGKVKRIRRNPVVRAAPCTGRGRLRAEPVIARAELLPATETSRVEALIARKYRLDMVIIKPLRSVQAALHLGRPRGESVIVRITPR
jgi:PPOX class probable F420-dependent enzyme